jgi:hypothetical protein
MKPIAPGSARRLDRSGRFHCGVEVGQSDRRGEGGGRIVEPGFSALGSGLFGLSPDKSGFSSGNSGLFRFVSGFIPGCDFGCKLLWMNWVLGFGGSFSGFGEGKFVFQERFTAKYTEYTKGRYGKERWEGKIIWEK